MKLDRDIPEELRGVDFKRLDLSQLDLDEEPSVPLRRWLWFGGLVVAGGVALWLPNTAFYQRTGDSPAKVFLLAAVGVAVGIALGTWLWRSIEQWAAQRAALPTWRLPPWFKWVSLGLIVTGGLGILVSSVFTLSDATKTTLAGVGFVTGIALAVWIGQRFDEWEARGR